jgi:hypothetical protein
MDSKQPSPIEDAGGGIRGCGFDGVAVSAVAGGVVEHIKAGGGDEVLVVARLLANKLVFSLFFPVC